MKSAERGDGGKTAPELMTERGDGGKTAPELMTKRGDGGKTAPELMTERGDGGKTAPELVTGYGDGEKTALELIREAGGYLPADCGGRGTCGKCRILCREGAPRASDRERELLTEEEIKDGIRLACLSRPEGAFRIEYAAEEKIDTQLSGIRASGKENGAVLAVDIGTTTIAMALLQEGKPVSFASSVNHQRSFGADVISRIAAANDGHGKELRELLLADLRRAAQELGVSYDGTPSVISANTTMQHLLCGLSCEGLGASPFTPVDIALRRDGGQTLLPGISAFVGADIVSGIVACGMDQSSELCMLIDLGTNGEMALGNRDRILTASTAAGPAFEGGNISCGMPGVPGAVSRVSIREGEVSLQTIADGEPAGLCGSGVLEIVYELLRAGLLDETGLLDARYREKGFPFAEGLCFTQKDVREVQLAKGAVCAGVLTLLKTFGASEDQVKTLYLSGGFGQKLDCGKAAGIGLLPERLAERAEASGNTSLAGAILFATGAAERERFLRAVRISGEVSLAESEMFRELFLEQMYF